MARDVSVYKRTRGDKNIVTDRNTSDDGGVYANPHTVSQNWRAFSLTAVLLTNDRTEAKYLLQNGANRGTPPPRKTLSSRQSLPFNLLGQNAITAGALSLLRQVRVSPLAEVPLLLPIHVLRVDKLTRVFLPVLVYRPDWPRRDTGNDRIVRNVMRYDGAGAHDAVSADSHARHDHGVHPDMRVVADGDTAEPIDICQLRIHMPQRPDTAVMGRDLNAARDPDVVADCHQVRLGAEVKSVKNLTPPRS